jgi:hypothetical protein
VPFRCHSVGSVVGFTEHAGLFQRLPAGHKHCPSPAKERILVKVQNLLGGKHHHYIWHIFLLAHSKESLNSCLSLWVDEWMKPWEDITIFGDTQRTGKNCNVLAVSLNGIYSFVIPFCHLCLSQMSPRIAL